MDTMVNIGSFALLFPGQGAQTVGMGKLFFENSPEARALFLKADDILGFELSKLCFEGPEEQLNLTLYSQPAIFVTSLALWTAVKNSCPGINPAVTCGLSLGEFSALTAAGVLGFEEGLRLVQKRGRWMHAAGEKQPGTMCSIIGLSPSDCEQVAAESGAYVANYNSLEQTALSGNAEAIEKAMALAKTKGAKKVIALKVSGAFHSPLMSSAQVLLAEELRQVSLETPEISVICNVTAEVTSEEETIRENLEAQVTHSVRWVQTMQEMEKLGIKNALEVGPGKVLKGLAKRSFPGFSVTNIETPQDLDQLSVLIGNTRT